MALWSARKCRLFITMLMIMQTITLLSTTNRAPFMVFVTAETVNRNNNDKDTGNNVNEEAMCSSCEDYDPFRCQVMLSSLTMFPSPHDDESQQCDDGNIVNDGSIT